VIDIRLIEIKPEEVRKLLKKKGVDAPIDEILRLNQERKDLIKEVDSLRHLQNVTSREIQKNPSNKEELIAQVKGIVPKLRELEDKLKNIESSINELILSLPNLPHESVPEGKDETGNIPIKYSGSIPQFYFVPKD